MATRKTVEVKPAVESMARIKVVGVGGSGGSAINRMLSQKVRGIEFIAINTDAQALQHSIADIKVQIGKETTRGLGAGMNPDLGRRSAEENEDDIRKHLVDADMVFVTCGLGGGTGSGAADIVADIARSAGALTVAVVTRPFKFEGLQRRRIAEEALDRLADKVDTIITIPNDRLMQIIDKKTSLIDAFSIVDDILRQGVIGISELITIPGMVNVDFADVKAVMSEAGSALMGIGIASGEERASMAARAAVDSPLLELSIEGARGVLFVITASPSLTMHEVNQAAEVITASCDPEAKIIFGTVIDDRMGDDIKITVIATGFRNLGEKQSSEPKQVRVTPITTELFTSTEPVRANRDVFTKQQEKPVAATEPEVQDELDIPAFIRNRMKKRS